MIYPKMYGSFIAGGVMKIKIERIISVVCISLLFSITLTAQIEKKAQVGFRFLENPVSAEVMGKGGVGVVNQYSANSIFWNPALTGKIKSTIDVGLNHTKGMADINYNALAIAYKAEGIGVFTASIISMDYGDFYGTVRAPTSEGYIETGTFSPAAYAVGLGFSQAVTDRFSYGVHLKYAYQDIGEAYISTGASFEDSLFSLSTIQYNKGVFAADIGAFYDFMYKGIKFGATLQNISAEVKYEVQEFPLPFAVSFGATIEPLLFFLKNNETHALILSIETRHPRDFGEKVKLGAEYNFEDVLLVRAGYQMNYDERDWTAGLGLKQEIVGAQIRIDYAIEPFGNRHFISVGFAY